MLNDSFLSRIKSKARSNQLCIAFGSRFSNGTTIPKFAVEISNKFSVPFHVENELDWFVQWNELINKTEKIVTRSVLNNFAHETLSMASVDANHRKLATIPVSNFIDITLDKSFVRALKEAGKEPIQHNFLSQNLGSWRQSNPDRPNVFFAFADVPSLHPWHGLHQQITIHPQNRIQIENMMEMVRNKDLLILGMTPHEAEYILHLSHLAQAADKVVNTEDPIEDHQYWTKRGVYLASVPTMAVIEDLMPHDLQSYTAFDAPFPGRMLIDVARTKTYDAFVSYFTGDQEFASRISGDLKNRDILIWRDQGEIDIGDSISDKIQEGLKDCYSFIIVLSSEALNRPWVKEELRAAYNLRLAEELKIIPVVYKDCQMPVFLTDYRFADFREDKNYAEQIEILARSIKNAVKRARNKK